MLPMVVTAVAIIATSMSRSMRKAWIRIVGRRIRARKCVFRGDGDSQQREFWDDSVNEGIALEERRGIAACRDHQGIGFVMLGVSLNKPLDHAADAVVDALEHRLRRVATEGLVVG